MKKTFLGLLATFVSIGIGATPIILSTDDLSLNVNDIRKIDKQKYCVAGALYDAETPQMKGVVFLIDFRKKSSKKYAIALPNRDYFQNIASTCGHMNRQLWVVQSVDTQSFQSTNQTLLYVTKINTKHPHHLVELPYGSAYFERVTEDGDVHQGQLRFETLLKKQNESIEKYSITMDHRFKPLAMSQGVAQELNRKTPTNLSIYDHETSKIIGDQKIRVQKTLKNNQTVYWIDIVSKEK